MAHYRLGNQEEAIAAVQQAVKLCQNHHNIGFQHFHGRESSATGANPHPCFCFWKGSGSWLSILDFVSSEGIGGEWLGAQSA
ncbi:MAG: hypothetical protein AB4426_15910 [Xenococcaceae cyanobacterium]